MNEQQIFEELKVIKSERESLLNDIAIAQVRIAELNTQRQNIIMG